VAGRAVHFTHKPQGRSARDSLSCGGKSCSFHSRTPGEIGQRLSSAVAGRAVNFRFIEYFPDTHDNNPSVLTFDMFDLYFCK
jgi:hypothetical protein